MTHHLEKTIPAYLSNIEVVDFWMKQPRKRKIKLTLSSFEFESVFDYGTNDKKKSLMILIETAIFHEKYGKVASITTACYFSIEDFDKFQPDKKGCLIIPEDTLAEFYTVAYSTSRGLLYSQVRGTFLHIAFLPLTDVYTGTKKRKEENKVEK
jgi:hypothetical protein